MGDIGPGDRQHARDACAFELRQLLVEARRQVAANARNRCLDDVRVVEQPVGCRRQLFSGLLRARERLRDLADMAGIFLCSLSWIEVLDANDQRRAPFSDSAAESPQVALVLEAGSNWYLAPRGRGNGFLPLYRTGMHVH